MSALLIFIFWFTPAYASPKRDLTLMQLAEIACSEMAMSTWQNHIGNKIDPTISNLYDEYKANKKLPLNAVADSKKYRPLLKLFRAIPEEFGEFKGKCTGYSYLRLELCFPEYRKSESDTLPCIEDANRGGDFSIEAMRKVIANKLTKNKKWQPRASDDEFSKYKERDGEINQYKLAQFLSLAKRKPTIKGFLDELVKKTKHGFSTFALAHHSASLQAASWFSPRAIVSLNGGRLIFSFIDDPKAPGNSSFEIMNFENTTKSFSFRTILFKKENNGNEISLKPEEVDFENSNVRISKPNVQACLSCHGMKDPTPNWDSYPLWPGFYGGDHAEFGLQQNKKSIFLHSNIEKENFEKFASSMRPESRYSVLAKDNFYNNVSENVEVITGELSQLNHQKILNSILNTPRIRFFAPALLALNYCTDYEAYNFIPSQISGIRPLKANALKLLQADTVQHIHSYFEGRVARLVKFLPEGSAEVNVEIFNQRVGSNINRELYGLLEDRGSQKDIPPLVALRNIVEGLGGQTNWSTGFLYPGDPKLNYAFFDGEFGLPIIMANISKEIVNRNWVSRELSSAIKSQNPDLCRIIEKESVKSLELMQSTLGKF